MCCIILNSVPDVSEEEAVELKEDDSDIIDDLPREIYCDLVHTISKQCAQYSILEIWRYDEDIIKSLTTQDIINDLNTVKKSPVTGYDANYAYFLGGKKYNESGAIVGAKSVMNLWFTEWEPDKIEVSTKLVGMDLKKADPFTMEWEAAVIDNFLELADDMHEEGNGFELYCYFARR